MSLLGKDGEYDTSTARGYLLGVFGYLQTDSEWKLSDAEATADHALSLFAHELAEEIRDFAARRLQIDSDDETYGMHMAADMIDPEVKK